MSDYLTTHSPREPRGAERERGKRVNGIERIAAERQRQIEHEGYTPEHDAEHSEDGTPFRQQSLAWAAVCYAAPETVYRVKVDDNRIVWVEPWPSERGQRRGELVWVPWHRPEADRIRELEKAGALIAAEIDRLLAAPVGPQTREGEEGTHRVIAFRAGKPTMTRPGEGTPGRCGVQVTGGICVMREGHAGSHGQVGLR